MSETPPAQIENSASRQVARYVPSAGSHIDRACEEACRYAATDNDIVAFTFNGITLVANPKTDWRELSKQYSEKSDQRREDYRKSPEGIAAATQRADDVAKKQKIVSDLIYALPKVLAGGRLDDAITWLKQFTNPADDIEVKFNASEVARSFIAYGWKENDCVGEKPEWFNSKYRMGRYIVGQAINCLKMGMAPHGITLSFIEKYEALPVSSPTTSNATRASNK
jgi:hypothetical protein